MLTISLVNGVAYGSLLFLLAAGFSMIFGVLKVINLAHGSYYLFGAHVAISVFEAGAGLAVAALAGAAVGAAFGAVCERAFLYRLQGDYLAQVLVTVGLLLVLGDTAQIVWGGTPRILTLPAAITFRIPLGPFAYPGDRLFLVAIGAITAFGLWWAVERTIFGATVRAAVDDEETAQAIGISVPRLRLVVFAFGGLLAGFSGALGASFVGAKPGLDLEVFLLALVIVVVGGPGSLPGTYIAALFVGIIDSVGKTFWPEASLFMLFVPMAAILAFRPTGLFGKPIAVTVAPRRARGRGGLAQAATPLIRRGLDLHARLPRAAWPAVWLALAVLWPFLASQYATSVVALALIWAIVAMGLNILLGYAGMPSLGHAVFFGTGAYTVALAGRHLGVDGWTALGLAACAALVMACIIGLVALRTRQVQLLLATIALSQIVWGIAFKWRALTGGDDGMRNAQKIAVPGAGELGRTTTIYIVAALVFLVVHVVLRVFDRSRFRRVLNGVRENEARLAALGYNVWLYRFGAFVLSGTISGIGGGLYAFYAGFVSPELLGVVTSAKMLLMVIIGGAGTFAGPIVGAFGLVFLEEGLSAWTERWFMLEGVLYIVVALLTTGGIVGSLRAAMPVRGAT
jgi:branched-chain amino acid transport system permease protein